MANKNEVKRGMLVVSKVIIVQKKQNFIGESGDYYYNMAATSDSGDMIAFTSGKICDDVELFKPYELTFDFIDKKLKLVTIEACK